MQRDDFAGIFRAMGDRPVTIRTLDPPLHEFLPHGEKEREAVARQAGVDPRLVARKVAELHEMNPMLGHRGCRLGIVYPEITRMQARAILEAACIVKKEGVDVKPEIMIPLVGHVNELKDQEKIVREVAEDVFAKAGITVDYLVGTMIELPRAALRANELAEVAEFFSFGTNDLTQTTFGLSRDDAGKFLPEYVRREILPADPFEKLDQGGVGKLVKMGVDLGRDDPAEAEGRHLRRARRRAASIAFCHEAGLDYVSCSPFRVPIARLAAGAGSGARGGRRCPAGRRRRRQGVEGRDSRAAKPTPKPAPQKAKAAPKPAKAPAKKAAKEVVEDHAEGEGGTEKGREGRYESEAGSRRRPQRRSPRRRARSNRTTRGRRERPRVPRSRNGRFAAAGRRRRAAICAVSRYEAFGPPAGSSHAEGSSAGSRCVMTDARGKRAFTPLSIVPRRGRAPAARSSFRGPGRACR